MRRCLLVLVLLTACGSTATSPAGFEPPKGAVEVEPGVWSLDQMLYGTDCGRLTALTKEAQPFGPSERRADGSYDSGYGTVCSH